MLVSESKNTVKPFHYHKNNEYMWAQYFIALFMFLLITFTDTQLQYTISLKNTC